MGNFGNSNPKVIAAAFAAAAVIGAGAVFVMNGTFSSVLPGTNAKNEAKPTASPESVVPKKDDTPAEAVQAIVKLAENHDVAAFKARVDMKMAEKLGSDGIILLYDGADVSLPGKVHEAMEGALAGSVPDKVRSIAIDLGLIGTDFVGVGEVQENGSKANVVVNLGGENLPNGFPLQIVMEKREGKWNVVSISNSGDYVKALRAGQNAAAMRYVEQERPFIKKYNDTIKNLKAKYPVLSAEYANGYEAAEKELMAGYASLTPPKRASNLVKLRKRRHDFAMEHIQLIRAYVAGDHSEANRQQRKEAENHIDGIANSITKAIQRFKE